MSKTAKPSAAAIAVFEKPQTEIAVQTAPAQGFEGGSAEDMILPNILVIQPMSKLATRDQDPKTPGSFVNSLTEESYGTSLEFIPIVFSKYWNVLKPEGNKMAFDYRVFDRNDPRLEGKRFYRDGDKKKEVEEVMNYLGLVNDQPAVVKFKSSSIKGGKKLYTLAKLSRRDLWATKYKLRSVKQTNEQGTFWVIDVEPIGPVTGDELTNAQTFRSTFAPNAAAVTEAAGEEVPF